MGGLNCLFHASDCFIQQELEVARTADFACLATLIAFPWLSLCLPQLLR
jgi:hypothetical protein